MASCLSCSEWSFEDHVEDGEFEEAIGSCRFFSIERKRGNEYSTFLAFGGSCPACQHYEFFATDELNTFELSDDDIPF